MIKDKSEDDLIRAEAMGWLLRLHSYARGCAPPKQVWAQFENWLASDTQRRETYLRLEREWPARRERLRKYFRSILDDERREN